MENTNKLILSKISENEMMMKLSSKTENIKITTLICSLPFMNQLICDIGHDLLQKIINEMIIFDIAKNEEVNSENNYLYFLIKGELYAKNSQYQDFCDTVEGPLNLLNKNNITNYDKNICPITLSAVSESIIMQISIKYINEAKEIISQRDVNDFISNDMLNRHLSRLQIEKMNKYTKRKIFKKNQIVYSEGDKPKEIFFIKSGKFLITKKRKKLNDYKTKIKLVDLEIKILSKQSDLYNFCLNGHFSLKSKPIVQLSKQLEEEKSTLPLPDVNSGESEPTINVR